MTLNQAIAILRNRTAVPIKHHEALDVLCQAAQGKSAVPDEWRVTMQQLIEHGRDATVRCGGGRCREPNCSSCCGEDEAAVYVNEARKVYAKAHAMLAAQEKGS